MITFVDSKNQGLYNTRFEQATAILKANEVINADSEITTLEEYFLYLKDLAQLDAYYTMLPVDEETFDIDADSRKITVPASFAKNGIGVQGDEIAEVVYFTIDRFFDATDLSDASMNIAIQWETSNKIAGVSREFIRDITSRPGKLIFGWPLSSEITNNPGSVKFSVRFYKIGERNVTADNGQEVTQPYLTYNFNTLTAEAKINGSLDYDLHGKDTKLDIVNHNDLILSRIVNSVLTDPSIPEPGDPEWYLNIAASDAKRDLVKDLVVLQQEVIDGIAVPVKGLVLEAYAVGDGAISYNWLQSDVNVNGDVASEEVPVALFNNAAYKPATAGVRDPKKVYYVAVYHYGKDENNNDVITGIDGYKPYSLTDNEVVIDSNGKIEVNGTEIQLYERHSVAVATGTGLYHVVAVNRRVGKTATIDSYHIVIPMPRIPNIETELFPEGKVTDTTGEQFDAVKDDEIIHVLLERAVGGNGGRTTLHTTAVSPEIADAEAEGLEEPVVELTYQWYIADDDGIDGMDIFTSTPEGGAIDDSHKIASATDASYEVTVAANAFDDYDKIFYAKVFNNRNLAQAFKYSKAYRVTAAPEKPNLISPLGANYNGIMLVTKPLGQSVTLTLGDIHSDGYTYQWYKAVLGENEDVPEYDPTNDTLIEDATGRTFSPEASGYYYCVMTNHLNGAQNSAYSPFCSFTDRG